MFRLVTGLLARASIEPAEFIGKCRALFILARMV
jgi:hypothetical protein